MLQNRISLRGILVAFILLSFGVFFCSKDDDEELTITADPEPGSFSEAVDITLTASIEDATIYYTIDGSQPTLESDIYKDPITLSATTTLKGFAVATIKDEGVVGIGDDENRQIESEVLSGEYIITTGSGTGAATSIDTGSSDSSNNSNDNQVAQEIAHCRQDDKYWYDEACNEEVITCDLNKGLKLAEGGESCDAISAVEAVNITACHAISKYWYSSSCNTSPITCSKDLGKKILDNETCKNLSLSEADTEVSCEALEYHWYSSTCNLNPPAPTVTGTSLTADRTPTWTWTSGGGGNGTYCYKLDDSDLSSGCTETTSTSYTPGSNLSQTTHTLYVKEKDSNGNWSSVANYPIQIVMGTFIKLVGGTTSEYLYSVVETTDGGFVTCGFVESDGAGTKDGFLFKTDSYGNVVWDRTIGGADNDYLKAVIEIDDGYIVAGYTSSDGAGSADGMLVKVNSSGVIVWDKTYGGSAGDYFHSVVETTDGYIAAGYTLSDGAGGIDGFIVKVDNSGNIVWDKTYGGTGSDYLKRIVATTGGFIVAGYTNGDGAGDYDGFLIKIDSTGNIIWDRTFGGTDWDAFESVVNTSDGGFVAAGKTQSDGAGGNDGFLIKVDSSGTIVWDKTIGSTGSDIFNTVLATTDGGFIAAGYTGGDGGGGLDGFLVKVDSSGTLVWDKTVGGSEDEWIFSVIETSDGGLMTAGKSPSDGAGESDGLLMKIDGNGNFTGSGSSWLATADDADSTANADTADTEANADDADAEANADTADTEANADDADAEADADDADTETSIYSYP